MDPSRHQDQTSSVTKGRCGAKSLSRSESAVRRVTAAVATGDGEQARSAYQAAVPVIDSLVNKKVIHRNQANRHKSRLATKLKALKGSK